MTRIFTEAEVLAIRHANERIADIARRYGIGPSSIYCIKHGLTYKNIGGPRGVRQPKQRFTDEEIREMRSASGTLRHIASYYGCSAAYVCMVKQGQKRRSA